MDKEANRDMFRHNMERKDDRSAQVHESFVYFYSMNALTIACNHTYVAIIFAITVFWALSKLLTLYCLV
jgi:hypothetical protein